MCSSRPVGDGIYEISVPCSWAEKGHKLYAVRAYEQSYSVTYSDWLERLVHPPADTGRPRNEGPDTAEAELALAVRMGLVDEAEALEGRA